MRAPSMRSTREGVWMIIGSAGAINEIFLRSGGERPYVLAFCATLLGIPALLSWDRSKHQQPEAKPEDPSP